MESSPFLLTAYGDDVEDAFNNALHGICNELDPGDEGFYIGKITGKKDFVMIHAPLDTGMNNNMLNLASKLIYDNDERIANENAGCMDMDGGKFLFFGWS